MILPFGAATQQLRLAAITRRPSDRAHPWEGNARQVTPGGFCCRSPHGSEKKGLPRDQCKILCQSRRQASAIPAGLATPLDASLGKGRFIPASSQLRCGVSDLLSWRDRCNRPRGEASSGGRHCCLSVKTLQWARNQRVPRHRRGLVCAVFRSAPLCVTCRGHRSPSRSLGPICLRVQRERAEGVLVYFFCPLIALAYYRHRSRGADLSRATGDDSRGRCFMLTGRARHPRDRGLASAPRRHRDVAR